MADLRVFVYRVINFVRQFFNRSQGYTRYFVGTYLGGYGADGLGISPVGGIEEPPLPTSVHSMWIGHLTDTSAVITARILNPVQNTSYLFQVSNNVNFSSGTAYGTFFHDSFGIIRINTINNLLPNTRYYARLILRFPPIFNFTVSNYIGSFKTPPAGTHSFKFGFGSCSRSCPPDCDLENLFNTASNSRLYDNLATKATNNELDFFVHLGDMHYRDISINQEKFYQDAYNDVFNSTRQNNAWKNLPMYYMWDDHDYGVNDTDKNSPSRDAARAAYRRRVPSPQLARSGSTDAPYYSFVKGRVRFIVTDIRSEREPKGTYASTNALQQVFSADQKQWFFDQMLAAKDNNQIIVWANTNPWVSSIQNGKDDWGGYHYARMEIVNFINANSLADRIVIISGDMHALAYDDGTSPNNYGSLKVCHAAPLDQKISLKGGPYTIGPTYTGSIGSFASQYGIIEVTDTGGATINIRFKGIIVDQSNGSETTPIDVNFDLNTGYVPPSPSAGDPYSDYVSLLLNFNT